MNVTAPLEQAIAASRSVLANISTDQMDDDTPCQSWDVSELVNHMIGAPAFFASAMSGQPPNAEPGDFSAGDYLAAFDEATAGVVAGFQAEGAMDKIFNLPFGDMPGSAFMGLAMTDVLQHAWDLAKATGQDTNLAPELAETLLAQSRNAIQDAFRGAEGEAPFGAEKEAPDGASAADRLAAFLGRGV